jgi:hypothetical protein
MGANVSSQNQTSTIINETTNTVTKSSLSQQAANVSSSQTIKIGVSNVTMKCPDKLPGEPNPCPEGCTNTVTGASGINQKIENSLNFSALSSVEDKTKLSNEVANKASQAAAASLTNSLGIGANVNNQNIVNNMQNTIKNDLIENNISSCIADSVASQVADINVHDIYMVGCKNEVTGGADISQDIVNKATVSCTGTVVSDTVAEIKATNDSSQSTTATLKLDSNIFGTAGLILIVGICIAAFVAYKGYSTASSAASTMEAGAESGPSGSGSGSGSGSSRSGSGSSSNSLLKLIVNSMQFGMFMLFLLVVVILLYTYWGPCRSFYIVFGIWFLCLCVANIINETYFQIFITLLFVFTVGLYINWGPCQEFYFSLFFWVVLSLVYYFYGKNMNKKGVEQVQAPVLVQAPVSVQAPVKEPGKVQSRMPEENDNFENSMDDFYKSDKVNDKGSSKIKPITPTIGINNMDIGKLADNIKPIGPNEGKFAKDLRLKTEARLKAANTEPVTELQMGKKKKKNTKIPKKESLIDKLCLKKSLRKKQV